MSKINIRLAAGPEDGAELGHLAALGGFFTAGFDLDWSDVFPHWIIAEVEGDIAGAIQVCPGKPIARLEWLLIHPRYRHRMRAQIAKALWYAGLGTLKRAGAQMASSLIEFDDPGTKAVLEHRAAVEIGQGRIMIKRL